MTRWLEGLHRATGIALDALVALIFTAMLVLAASQIALRNLFNFSLLWGDGLLRLLVLWLAMAGAMAASRADKHIRIALLDRYLPDAVMRWVKPALDLFTATVCGVLAWQSARFVLDSLTFGDVILGGVPAWWGQVIMPVGFGFIALRYLLAAATEPWQGPRGSGP